MLSAHPIITISIIFAEIIRSSSYIYTDTTCQKPIDVVFLIDLSGSVELNQRKFQSQVTQYVVRKLKAIDERHRIAVVSFGSNAEVVAGFTKINDAEEISKALHTPDKDYDKDALSNLHIGLEKVSDLFDTGARENAIKAVITVSDCRITPEENKSPNEILAKPMEDLHKREVKSFVIGVADFDKSVARIIADSPLSDYLYQTNMELLVNKLLALSEQSCKEGGWKFIL